MHPWLWRRNGRRFWTFWKMKTSGASQSYKMDKLIPMALHQFMGQWLKSLWDHITILLKRWISPHSKLLSFSTCWNLWWRIKLVTCGWPRTTPQYEAPWRHDYGCHSYVEEVPNPGSSPWGGICKRQISSQMWCHNACKLANFPLKKLVKMNKHLSTFKSALHREGSLLQFTLPN